MLTGSLMPDVEKTYRNCSALFTYSLVRIVSLSKMPSGRDEMTLRDKSLY